MAGNVKEWCWNATGDRRYMLGGAWNEPRPYYAIPEARSPFDRSPVNGFRCVKYLQDALANSLTEPVEKPTRDYRTEKPVSDSVFRILQRFYSYDRTELKAKTESVDESSPYWRTERITFDAAYDHQRVTAWLYLPRNAKPPYQTIVFFPPGHALTVGSIDEAEIKRMDFLMRSGRAVVFPVYQGTFERRPHLPHGPSGERDQTIQQAKDLQRSVDYLEARQDLAHDQLGFFGISGGSHKGLIALPLEPRIRAAVMAEAGLPAVRTPPEVDPINFAPRVRIPVLMLNGRYSLPQPVETSQVPLFRLLGTPEKDKRHVLFESGSRGPTQQYIKETLDWFDRYLGPVSR
jgi:dienelactone hydrolase